MDARTGLLLEGPTRVYAAGNVLTGKGNIKDSLDNATEVGTLVAERYLGLADDGARAPLADGTRAKANQAGTDIAASIATKAKLPEEDVARIIERVRVRQKQAGYDGDYRGWIRRVTPPDLG